LEFWDKLKEIVEQRLRERGAGDEWIVTLSVNDSSAPAEPKDFVRCGGQLELTPGPTNGMPLFWAYWVEQRYDPSPRARSQSEDKLAPLWCGLGFYSENNHHMGEQAARLPQWAQALHDRPGVGWQSDRDSVSWGYVIYNKPAKIRARNEIVRLAQADDGLELEVADFLFDLFDRTHEDLMAENRRIRDGLREPHRRRGRG
jgi:hypothetical protein